VVERGLTEQGQKTMNSTQAIQNSGRLMTDPLIGQIIDRYRLVETIGDGAMANVYRAQHTTLTDRRYAIKVLRPNMARKPQIAARFRREARILSQIEHPNVVTVIDAGTTPHGLLYMVLEYAEGKTLKGLIQETGPMGVERAANIIRQISSALARVHSMGYIHRDIKPDNIVITRHEGREIVKILDFGIAGMIDADVDATRLTEVNLVCGTPHYMAPEQAAADDISSPVDIYAVGAILYELLTGKTPFVGPMSEVLVQKLMVNPSDPGFHGGLGPLSLQLLSRKPDARPTAVNLVEQIDRLQAAGWTAPANQNKPARRKQAPSIVRTMLAAGIAGFVAVSGFAAMNAQQDSAALESDSMSVAIQVATPAPVKKVAAASVIAEAPKAKKVRRKRSRVVRKKVTVQPRKSTPKAKNSNGGQLSEALARLTDAEVKEAVIPARPKYVAASAKAAVSTLAITPIAPDKAVSRPINVPNTRSHSNLPDSVRPLNAGSRLSSSTAPIKNTRRKAFARNKRSSAYRMAR
jgi:tRNA A-37 threonylcarbamoyl transferase component Bud32